MNPAGTATVTRRSTPGMIHDEQVWGTVVSFDVRDDLPTRAIREALDPAIAWLHKVDVVFSPFREDSVVSGIRRGERGTRSVPADVRDVLKRCERARQLTDGYFDPWNVPGGFDPSGLVKGWAADRAADILERAGLRHFSVNAGGDVICRGGVGSTTSGATSRTPVVRTAAWGGESPWVVQPPGDAAPSAVVAVAPGQVADWPTGMVPVVAQDSPGHSGDATTTSGPEPWVLGIRHPDDAAAICATVSVVSGCIASSGTYERGEHVSDPLTGRPATGARAATVVGRDGGLADALATALLVAGREGLSWIAALPGWSALIVVGDQTLAVGPAFGPASGVRNGR